MSRKTLIDNEDWVLQKDDDKKTLIISYFEDNHFRDELIVPYEDLKLKQTDVMIKFTQTRVDWNSIEFGLRMLRAGKDGYQSLYHDVDYDDYALLSTVTQNQLHEKYTLDDLENIWNELETLGEKESKEFRVSSGEIVELYWEIDRFSR